MTVNFITLYSDVSQKNDGLSFAKRGVTDCNIPLTYIVLIQYNVLALDFFFVKL